MTPFGWQHAKVKSTKSNPPSKVAKSAFMSTLFEQRPQAQIRSNAKYLCAHQIANDKTRLRPNGLALLYNAVALLGLCPSGTDFWGGVIKDLDLDGTSLRFSLSPHHPPPKFSEGKPSTFFLAAKAQLNSCTFVLSVRQSVHPWSILKISQFCPCLVLVWSRLFTTDNSVVRNCSLYCS